MTFGAVQVRSTTSYYQVAVNLPSTYYGNVTVSLTVRAHTSSVPAITMVQQASAKCQGWTRFDVANLLAADQAARTTMFYQHLALCKAILLSRPAQSCTCEGDLDKANASL